MSSTAPRRTSGTLPDSKSRNVTITTPATVPLAAEFTSSAADISSVPQASTAALDAASTAIAAAAAASTRCLRWRDQFRMSGDIELPAAMPRLNAGNSSPAAHVVPRSAQMNGNTTKTLLSCIPAV